MLFHRYTPKDMSFASLGESEQRDKFQIHPLRFGLALLFLVILIVAAFVGKWLEFEQAAITFLHLSEVAAGGLVGLFFGERLTLTDRGRT